MTEPRKQHCWECLRRPLVCDFARPQCKRCATAGIPCPGYGKKEPRRLKWLPPGKVTSRRPKAVKPEAKPSPMCLFRPQNIVGDCNSIRVVRLPLTSPISEVRGAGIRVVGNPS
ncbi:uncharacterized protein LDX57_006947 [Aspergillus melleus]|uniref:uncharacterized protein n=1 Tax=Aspergillus melleus TaxID=138277 RepID=UPI001E8D22A7|nr:uncharacterized protein LDX57_006947 [Aspergillus melleus]KAH8429280.1 hypothetical protein LDX57_006947 [Aspergillus melleus]